MEADQYERESECEDLVDYGADGYHPVTLGEKFKGIYTVVQKLGWGHFSTVWLAQKQQSQQHVALKIQRSKDTHTESAIDELQMLTEIQRHEQDPEWLEFLSQMEALHSSQINVKLCRPLLLLDNFPHYGIHGKHMCSVFELMGPNLLDVIQHYEYKDKRMPLWLVKKITRDTLLGLVYLHERCRIIHTDLKPENIMIKMEGYEEQQLIEQLKNYKVKPLSMKYLKNLQAAKNPKNKKKQEKKKLKKKKVQEQGQKKEGEDEVEGEEQESSSNIPEGAKVQQSAESQSPSPTPIQIQKVPEAVSSSQLAQSSKNQQSNSGLNNSMNDQHSSKQDDEWSDIQQGVDMSVLVWKSVQIKLNDRLFFKIADMGNACFIHKHFTEDIQTREYRAPEVIIGHEYFPNTDIFSLGCTVFEMMTNNFLFKPKKISGIKKDEDHLYQMLESLGPISKTMACNGRNSAELFNKKGKLLNGDPKSVYPLSRRLHEKYDYDLQAAIAAEEFLLPMLAMEPSARIDARTCLASKWLWN